MRRRELLTGTLALGALAGCAAPAGDPTAAAAPAGASGAGAGTGPAAATASMAEGGPTDRVLSRIGLGSCIDQTKPQPIWDAVLAGRPDLFLFGGDNVYASQQPWSVQALRDAYAMEAAVPGFARLRREVPHLAIWDDHDYGLNDGGAEFAHKAASKAEFLSFWNVPADDPRRTRDGLYHARSYGRPGRRVQVILLDARWFRSPWKPTDRRNAPGRERYLPDPDPSATMLGDAQWRWLEERLREPADVRIILSGIQVVADGHGWECWANFPRERERLYGLIGKTRADGVVFLAGDRHIGGIYRQAENVPYPMHELTSSGITHPWRDAAEAGPNRLALFTELHYGTVDIDWTHRTVELVLRDLQGQARHSRLIPLNELRNKT